MKIAILGAQAPAIVLGQELISLGASVTLFTNGCPLSEDDLKALELAKIQTGKLLRVHKAFLGQDEMPVGFGRLIDLFRVVYEVNPEEQIKAENERYQDILNQLPKDVASALKHTIELFEDCDCVIDARTPSEGEAHLKEGAFAIGERLMREQHPEYFSSKVVSNFSQIGPYKRITLVGTGLEAVNFLNQWNQAGRACFVDWILPQGITFELLNSLESLLKEIETENQLAHASYQKKLEEWRELDDFVKVKIPVPNIPQSPLTLYLGHSIIATQKLSDHDGIFTSIERPEFRVVSENFYPSLVSERTEATLRADVIFNYQFSLPYRETFRGMRLPISSDVMEINETYEPGLFVMANLQKGPAYYTVDEALNSRGKFLNILRTYFSPRND